MKHTLAIALLAAGLSTGANAQGLPVVGALPVVGPVVGNVLSSVPVLGNGGITALPDLSPVFQVAGVGANLVGQLTGTGLPLLTSTLDVLPAVAPIANGVLPTLSPVLDGTLPILGPVIDGVVP